MKLYRKYSLFGFFLMLTFTNPIYSYAQESLFIEVILNSENDVKANLYYTSDPSINAGFSHKKKLQPSISKYKNVASLKFYIPSDTIISKIKLTFNSLTDSIFKLHSITVNFDKINFKIKGNEILDYFLLSKCIHVIDDNSEYITLRMNPTCDKKVPFIWMPNSFSTHFKEVIKSEQSFINVEMSAQLIGNVQVALNYRDKIKRIYKKIVPGKHNIINYYFLIDSISKLNKFSIYPSSNGTNDIKINSISFQLMDKTSVFQGSEIQTEFKLRHIENYFLDNDGTLNLKTIFQNDMKTYLNYEIKRSISILWFLLTLFPLYIINNFVIKFNKINEYLNRT